MDSRISIGSGFAFALAWRTILAAALIFLLLQVLATTQYYATALILAVLFVLTIADTACLYARDRIGITTASAVLPRDQARQLDEMLALLDAVSVALVVLSSDNRIAFANRATRLLAGEDVGRLKTIRALGAEAAKLIETLPAGGRQIVTMADGRSLLVWVASISAPARPAQRLVSLQVVAGELDAVQLKAWQDMTRVLSHEMMNSLTPITSLSESLHHLLEDRGESEAARAVETIGRRSAHLMEFVDRYRQIADLPAPQLRPVLLGPFLADIDSLFGADLVSHGITYCGDRAEVNLTFLADPELLTQGLLNLLHNAAEAVVNQRIPAVTFECHVRAGNLVFRVTDNGPGINSDQLQEIFVPFYTTKANGSGIGLTLARQIAIAHGGSVSATSEANSGSTFDLAIPL